MVFEKQKLQFLQERKKQNQATRKNPQLVSSGPSFGPNERCQTTSDPQYQPKIKFLNRIIIKTSILVPNHPSLANQAKIPNLRFSHHQHPEIHKSIKKYK